MMMETNIQSRPMNLPHSKVCTKCWKKKSIEKFYYRCEDDRLIIESRCKLCHSEDDRVRYMYKRHGIKVLPEYTLLKFMPNNYLITFYDQSFNTYVGVVMIYGEMKVEGIADIKSFVNAENIPIFAEYEYSRMGEYEYERLRDLPTVIIDKNMDMDAGAAEFDNFMRLCYDRWSPKSVNKVEKRKK